MTGNPLDPLVEALRSVQGDPPSPTKIATVTALTATGVFVQFDGEAAASTKPYLRIGTDAIVVGQRVLMLRAGRSWVVAGQIGGGPGIQGANVVTAVNASGVGTVAFPIAYPSAPVVQMTGATGGLQCEVQDPGPTTTGFTFRTFSPTGTLQVSTSVRVLWSSHPAA